MAFTNFSIELSELPSINNIRFEALDRRYLRVMRISFCITGLVFLVAGIAAFYFIHDIRKPLIMAGVSIGFVVLSVMGWIANSLSFRNSGYALRQHDLLYKSGWWKRKTKVVPLNRIQHVSVQSGPLERRFLLASVSLYTAGTEEADFTITGVSEIRAMQIKEWVTDHLKQSHGNL